MMNILSLLLLSLSFAHAEELKYAPSAVLASETEHSVLEMNCTGDKPYKNIECDFTQKAIRRKLDEKKNVGQRIAEWKKEDINKLEADAERTCKKSKKLDIKAHPLPSIAEFQTEEIEVFEEFCKCAKVGKPFDCYKKMMDKKADMIERTCTFATNTFTVAFRQISKNKWMNTPEPKGLCNAVVATTLEWDGKFSWTYTQTRLSVDKDDLCGALDVNKPTIYKTGETTHKMKCDYIDMGPSI